MAVLRFADQTYFTSGHWERDLSQGLEPILIDPKWQHTALSKDLEGESGPHVASSRPGYFWMATSGSTGKPKLIEKNLPQITAEAEFWKLHFETILGWSLSETKRFLVTVPLCHIYGMIWGYALPQILGAQVHYLDAKSVNGSEFAESDVLVSVPYLLKIWKEKGYPLPKRIVSSGSKFPVPLAQAFRSEGKVDIREIYGSTETGAMGVRNPMWKARFTLLSGIQAKTISIHTDEVLQVKGTFVSESCLELEEKSLRNVLWTQKKLTDEEGFFLTMDAGELTDLGWNYFARIDRIFKVKGKRISLDVVESLVGATEGISEVAVVTYAMEEDMELACLLVSKKDLDEIKKDLRTRLPSSHIPSKIEIVDSLPKLPNGKIDYEEVIKRFTKDGIRR